MKVFLPTLAAVLEANFPFILFLSGNVFKRKTKIKKSQKLLPFVKMAVSLEVYPLN